MTPPYYDIWTALSYEDVNLLDYRYFQAFWTFIFDRMKPFTSAKLKFKKYEDLTLGEMEPLVGQIFGGFVDPVGGLIDLGSNISEPVRIFTPSFNSWVLISQYIFGLSVYYINRKMFKTDMPYIFFQDFRPEHWPDGFPEQTLDSTWKKPVTIGPTTYEPRFRCISKRRIGSDFKYNNPLHPLIKGSKAIFLPFFPIDVSSITDSERARLNYCVGKIFVWDGKVWNLDLKETEPDYLKELRLPRDDDIFGPWLITDLRLGLKQLKTVKYGIGVVDFDVEIDRQRIELDSAFNFVKIVTLPVENFKTGFFSAPFYIGSGSEYFLIVSVIIGTSLDINRSFVKGRWRFNLEKVNLEGAISQLFFKIDATSFNESEYPTNSISKFGDPVPEKYFPFGTYSVLKSSYYDFNANYEPWIFSLPKIIPVGDGNYYSDPFGYAITESSFEGDLAGGGTARPFIDVLRDWKVTDGYALYDWNFDYK